MQRKGLKEFEKSTPKAYKGKLDKIRAEEKSLHEKCSNYNLVNTLPYISKIAEKECYYNFQSTREDKLHKYISTYRDGFSTEMVLLGISDNILMSMDSQKIISMCAQISLQHLTLWTYVDVLAC